MLVPLVKDATPLLLLRQIAVADLLPVALQRPRAAVQLLVLQLQAGLVKRYFDELVRAILARRGLLAAKE